MNYIAWDTETTGLPTRNFRRGEKATRENVYKFDNCRLLTLAFVKYTSCGKEIGSYHGISYPDTFDVAATHVHGITQEYAREHGHPFGYLYASLKEATRDTKLLVAHNSYFDENVFFSECYRRGFETEPFDDVTFVDTLDMARTIFPTLYNHKLITVYTHIFGKGFDGAHDALNDSRACGEVYPRLRDNVWDLKDIGVEKVILKASDIASIIGKNQYKKPKEIIDNLWSKYKPETFEGKTKDQMALESIHKCNFATNIIQRLLKPSDTARDDAYGRTVSSRFDGDFGGSLCRVVVFTTYILSLCVSLLDFRRRVFIFFVVVVVYVVALAFFAPPLVLGD